MGMIKFWSPKWLIENWLTTYWVGTAISVAGALYGASKAGDAADAQVDSAQQGIDEIKAIGDRTRADTEPYRALGSGSASKLARMLGINPYGESQPNYSTSDLVNIDAKGNFVKNPLLSSLSPDYDRAFDEFVRIHQNQYGTDANLSKGSVENAAESQIGSLFNGGVDRLNQIARDKYTEFENDPTTGSLLRKFNQSDLDSDLVYQNGLQFGLNQGTKAIENRARAMGGLDSGSATKAAIQFSNDYATTKTEGAYNRNAGEKSRIYQMLMGGTGVGQNAVNTDASTGQNIATALAGQYAAQGNARAAGDISKGNAISGIADAIGSVF